MIISLKFVSSLIASVCRAVGNKRAILFLAIPSQKNGIKLETLVWRVVARCLRKPEEFRIQFGLQICTKPQRQ